MIIPVWIADIVIGCCGILGIAYGNFQHCVTTRVNLESHGYQGVITEGTPLVRYPGQEAETERIIQFQRLIRKGLESYFRSEYGLCLSFTLFFALIIFSIIAWSRESTVIATMTAVAYLLGSLLTAFVSAIGIYMSLVCGVRTAISAQEAGSLGYMKSFTTVFRGGAAFSFSIIGLLIIILLCVLEMFRLLFQNYTNSTNTATTVFAGLGLGASVIALFLRIGGGIFSNSCDIGANLIGKVMFDLEDDNPNNPAVIGDLVGDNVGNISGLSTDLVGSWIESTCAAVFICSQIPGLEKAGWTAIYFPLFILSSGIIVSAITSALSTMLNLTNRPRDIELSLRLQLMVTTILVMPFFLALSFIIIPDSFVVNGLASDRHVTVYGVSVCMIAGLVGALINGLITEFFTSNKYEPVQELALSAAKGAASEIMHGVSVGYRSVFPCALVLAVVIYVSFEIADVLGIALAAIGIVSLMPSYLIVGTNEPFFGPVCDNAVGIAALSQLEEETITKTKSLDNAGSSLSAISKGYASTSAFITALAVLGSIAYRTKIIVESSSKTSQIQDIGALTVAFLFLGTCIPYLLSSITLVSVNRCVAIVVETVANQLNENPAFTNLLSDFKPDYDKAIQIATTLSMQETIFPTILGIAFPIVVGLFFGVSGLIPLLIGFVFSGVHMDTAMSNTGCAWNSAKRIISVTEAGKGMTDLYKATVIGDTIGDPMKDTGGPALNILMKLMTISSFVLLPCYLAINEGKGLLDVHNN